MTAVARLDRVRKQFGNRVALHDLTLELRGGEVLALLGRNGAGKTTAVSILLGLRRPDAGRAELFGRDPREPSARTRVGATPQEIGFPPTLRVRELVELVRAHFPTPAPLPGLLERFGLADIQGRQTGGLSGGQKRRLAVALAFAGAPAAVFLDEPTTGLDVGARHALWEAVRTYAAEGGSVLLTTHYLEEAQALAGRVAVLDGGRLVAEGTPAALAAPGSATRIRIRARVPPDFREAERVETDGERTILYARDSEATIRGLLEAGVPLTDLEVIPASLEEAFLTLTRRKR